MCGADSKNISCFVLSPHTHPFYRNGINPVFISNLLRICLCSIIISFRLTDIYKLTPLFVAIVTVCLYAVYVQYNFLCVFCLAFVYINRRQSDEKNNNNNDGIKHRM